MPRAIKTYGWTAMISDKVLRKRLGMATHQIQCRGIVAAVSKSAAAHLVGVKYPYQLHCLSETGNAIEKAVAETDLGTIFVAPLDGGRSFNSYLKYDAHLYGRLA